MKLIPLRDEVPFKSVDVIRTVVSQPTPGQGINADDMRRRCRILDALEEANGNLVLEDADHAVLNGLVKSFQFGAAHPALLRVIDDVIEAKAPGAS